MFIIHSIVDKNAIIEGSIKITPGDCCAPANNDSQAGACASWERGLGITYWKMTLIANSEYYNAGNRGISVSSVPIVNTG